MKVRYKNESVGISIIINLLKHTLSTRCIKDIYLNTDIIKQLEDHYDVILFYHTGHKTLLKYYNFSFIVL